MRGGPAAQLTHPSSPPQFASDEPLSFEVDMDRVSQLMRNGKCWLLLLLLLLLLLRGVSACVHLFYFHLTQRG